MNVETKRELVNRLRSIQGHIKGIERMVEEDQYCIDILKQTDAVARALDRVDALLLGNHLETCVTTAIRADDQKERERVIGELMQVFQHSEKL
jgi:CsoR family transcriptional regulator, copper-sensing transcriptional repressor